MWEKMFRHTKVKSWPLLLACCAICSVGFWIFKHNSGVIEFAGMSIAILAVVFTTLNAIEQEPTND